MFFKMMLTNVTFCLIGSQHLTLLERVHWVLGEGLDSINLMKTFFYEVFNLVTGKTGNQITTCKESAVVVSYSPMPIQWKFS
jgi:hypothetical protein